MDFTPVAKALKKADISDAALEAVKGYLLAELKIMLGLTSMEEEDIEKIEPVFFDEVQDIYDQANDHCYFCSPMADPNEEPYGEFRRACPMCTLKLKRFMQAAKIKNPSGHLREAHRRC